MNLLPSPSELDVALRRGRWAIVLGLLAFVGIITLQNGPVFMAMAAVALGAMCTSFAEWRTQRGLWLLGIVFLAFLLPTYVVLMILGWFHLKSSGLGTWLDFSYGTMFLGELSRVLVAASIYNWRSARHASS